MTTISATTGHATTASTTTPNPVDARFGNQSGRILATVAIKGMDGDDDPFIHHDELIAGARVGAVNGYTTLNDAKAALWVLNDSSTPDVAVMEQNGRFYGYGVKERDLNDGVTSAIVSGQDLAAEAADNASDGYIPMTVAQHDTALRALIGTKAGVEPFMHTFRA